MKELNGLNWKDIPGYEGVYQASLMGAIRRLRKSKEPRLLTPYKKSTKKKKLGTTYDHHYVKLSGNELPVHKIIYITFMGAIPEGHCILHKNGVVHENFLQNLMLVSRKELGDLTGSRARRKPVVKIDKFGNIVNFYSSAKVAARDNYMSYQAIGNRCNERFCARSVFASDGYAYSWDEKKCITRTMNRIKKEGAKNKL